MAKLRELLTRLTGSKTNSQSPDVAPPPPAVDPTPPPPAAQEAEPTPEEAQPMPDDAEPVPHDPAISRVQSVSKEQLARAQREQDAVAKKLGLPSYDPTKAKE